MAGAVRRSFVTRPPTARTASGAARAAALLMTLLVLPALLVAGAVPAATSARAAGGCANVTQPGIIAGTTPILFVHGIDSDPTTWTSGTVNGTSVAPLDYVDGALGSQVACYTFDWTAYSGFRSGSTLSWVTGPPAPGPGQLLAQAIKCVAAKAGHQVIIVAHSMGGLLAKYASSVDSVSGDIAAVFTLGTPYQGSQLDSAATGAFGWLTQAIGGYCSGTGGKQHVKPSVGVNTLCRLVSQSGDPGMIGMRTYAQWHALTWPGTLQVSRQVFPLAASIQATSWQPLPLFGPQLTFADLGDFVVSTKSEFGGGTTPTVTCTVPITGVPALATLLSAVTASSCFHTNEPDNKTLLDTIISTIKQRSLIPTAATSAGSKTQATVTLPVTACPSSYGASHGSARVPDAITTTLPSVIAGQLAFYTDQYRYIDPVLAPRGWSCGAEFGADGSGGINVWPPGTQEPTSAGPTDPDQELVEAYTAGANESDIYGDLCPFDPATASRDYPVPASLGCSQSRPQGEHLSYPHGDASLILYDDPPGVSGENYPRYGALLYASPQAGTDPAVSGETCTLPDSEHVLCTAILNDFAARHWMLPP